VVGTLLLASGFRLPAQAHTQSRLDAHAPIEFDLNEQPLAAALHQIAQRAHISVSFDSAIPPQLRAPALHARVTPAEAIARVLMDSRLRASWVNERAVRIMQQPAPSPTQKVAPPRPGKTQADPELPPEKDKLEAVIVLGSNIPSTDMLAPVITLSRSELSNWGYSKLEDAFEQLPQNFSGVSRYSNPIVGNSPGAVYNQTFGSTFDLLGLGPNATLVMVNGFRLPSAVAGQLVDISGIPTTVVDHVEIITDAASALYGSDALGGVVNLLTLKSFKGVELTARSDGISTGKAANRAASVLAGTEWSTGNTVAMIGYEKDNPLYASARRFSATALGPTTLLPEQQITNAYARVRETPWDHFTQTLNVLASVQQYHGYDSLYGGMSILDGRAAQVDAVLQSEYKFTKDNKLSLALQLPIEKDFATTTYPWKASADLDHYMNQAPSVELHFDGVPFTIPSGDVKVASAVALRRERFEWESSYAPYVYGHRQVGSASGEIRAPLLTGSGRKPFVEQLTLDLAGRYDKYSDVGKSATPKASLLWQVNDQLSLHASYARAFKAPTLYELHAMPFAQIQSTTAPSASIPSNTLSIDGGNTSLRPEHARSVDIGFTYRPTSIPGVSIEASEVDIQYKDRIAELSQEGFTASSVLEEPTSLGDLVNLAPTKSQIEQILRTPGLRLLTPVDPNGVNAVAYMGYANAGSSSLRALDAIGRYHPDPDGNGFGVDIWTTYIQHYLNRITPQSSATTVVGTAYYPPSFRGTLNIGWRRGPWSGDGRLIYTSPYDNPGDPTCIQAPRCRVPDWMVVDIGLAYESQPPAQSTLGSTRIALAIKNLFGSDPPSFRGAHGLNLDPANANPMGRMWQVTVTQQLGFQ